MNPSNILLCKLTTKKLSDAVFVILNLKGNSIKILKSSSLIKGKMNQLQHLEAVVIKRKISLQIMKMIFMKLGPDKIQINESAVSKHRTVILIKLHPKLDLKLKWLNNLIARTGSWVQSMMNWFLKSKLNQNYSHHSHRIVVIRLRRSRFIKKRVFKFWAKLNANIMRKCFVTNK